LLLTLKPLKPKGPRLLRGFNPKTPNPKGPRLGPAFTKEIRGPYEVELSEHRQA
jgi:hypothetical protein